MIGSARRLGRRSWWGASVVLAVGLIVALVLGASPAFAIPVDPGDGDPPPDCVAGATATLTATPGTVMAGGAVTVGWSIQQVAGCSTIKRINGVGFGGSTVALSGSRSVTLSAVGTTNWSLEVFGSAGVTYTLDTASVTVQTPPPPLAAVSPLAAALDAGGKMQLVMARADDVVLRDAGQISSGRHFGGWTTAPGQLRSVASETDGSGRVVQVGFNGAGQIWGAIQDTAGGTGWLGWTPIDGLISSVALARNADGLLELFATNSAGTIFHRKQTAAGTVSFGQWFTFAGALTQIAAETNPDGRIEVVGLNGANQIWHLSQTAGSSNTWSGWAAISGALTSIAIARAPDPSGKLEIFGIDPSGALLSAFQVTGSGGNWNSLFTIPDGHRGPVAAETNADGRIMLFGLDSAGVMSYRTQSAPGTNFFGPWRALIQYRVGLSGGSKRKLLVIPVNWTAAGTTPAAPPTKSLNDVMAMVDNDWWAEVSYGQFPGWDVSGHGPVTIQTPRLDSDGHCGWTFLNDIKSQADDQAARAGFDVSKYTIIYWFTSIGDTCSWVGKNTGSIYINGRGEEVVNHELGHSVGLNHASSLACVGNVDNPVVWSNKCTRDEYGDLNDAMGAVGGAGFDSIERDHLGWMSGRITDVPVNGGTYTLSPLELASPGLKALRLTDGPLLWIEYRQDIGVDVDHLPNPGILVYTPYAEGASSILDLTPSTKSLLDDNLAIGSSWITPTGNYKVTLDWAVSTGAHITISLNRVTVPNVVGTDASTAESLLQAAGFGYVVHDVVDAACTHVNLVTGQGPAGLSQAIPGSTVTIDVNAAPAPPAECA